MTLRRIVFAVAFIAFSAAGLRGDDAAALAELKKLAQPPDAEALKGLSTEEADALHDKRAEAALRLLREIETKDPQSKSLAGARSLALTAVGHTSSDGLHDRGAAVAQALKEASAKGSDHAAQADLYLLGRRYHALTKDAKSPADLRKIYDANSERIRKAVADYAAEYPKYRPAADAFRLVVRLAESMDDETTAEAVARAVAKGLPDHPLAKALRRRDDVGKEIDFVFTPIGGTRTSLKARRGKVVVVFFWASWCPPCKAEMKHLKELHDKYGPQGLEVVHVSVDEKAPAAVKFLKEHGVGGTQVAGVGARTFAADWGIEHVPHQLVVDRKGKLRSGDAVGKLGELIPELLAEKE